MIRYQVRNEYGLSDPEVYAPPEKDDPEALLEGVAMAGLVGLLRQLGDLAEFAAEIFHDLHEDVMATASRGHGLMLRLQQLEAEFPAVEKAIISQSDHSNFLHEDGVEWHANLQLNQNMITTGDMPRFILDSYEECRGPPHLFTLDKFDVAGAGASLKRYSDPSFFKMEHASNMTETEGVREKKPRKIKKRALRWRKGETLESLLVEHSECQNTSSKDRASRKVPPRTTKLKSRHLRDSDHKTISKILKERLEEVILSQEKILSNYSARYYHGKFRSTESSEATSLFGELDNFNTPQSSAKHEVTKVVPINGYAAVKTASTANIGPLFTQADDDQFLTTKDGPELKDTCKKSCVEKNGISLTPQRLQEGKVFKGEESKCALKLVGEEQLQLAVVSVDQDDDHCRPDDIASDQDNFIDALHMESESDSDSKINTKRDLRSKVEEDKLICHSKEVGKGVPAQFSELGPAIKISSGLNDSCNGTEPAHLNSFSVSDSSPSVSDSKDTESDSASHRQLSGVNWVNDEEPVNDVDLMDVSSSSSVLSDHNGNCESNEYAAAVANSSDKQSPDTSTAIDGLTISNNDCDEKVYRSVEHDQNFVLDGASVLSRKPKEVSQDDGDIEDPDADDLLLHSTRRNEEQIQLFKEQIEECTSRDTGTSPSRLASLSDRDPVALMNNLGLDNVVFPEKKDTDTTPTGLDPDGIRWHLDDLDSGVAPIHSSTLNDPLHESDNDEIVESDDDEIVAELSLPDEDLYKHVSEDQEIIALGHCSIKLETQKDDPTQESVVPNHLSNVQGFQDDTETHVNEILEPSPCVLNDHTKPLSIDSPLDSSTATLLGTSSSCMERLESIETGKNVDCGQSLVEAEVVEGSTTSMFNDAMIPCDEERTGGAKYTEKSEVLGTNFKEENSRHDIPLQSSSSRENLETIEVTSENFGSLEESREHIFKENMLRTSNLPEPIEIETSGETFSCSNDIQYLSPLHFPEESICQEKLPEETSLSSEVPCQHDLDKDDAISLKTNVVREQTSNVDQYFARDLSDPDSVGINPFLDPGYELSCADPSPSMSYQPCCSEEQDFLSELLVQHDDTVAKKDLYPCADPIWESATPPDEEALPSEVMTEEDFKSFCHEYLEMDFTAPSSDSNDFLNGYEVNELQFPGTISVLPAGSDQEVVCSKPDSQLGGCSSARDIPGETFVPFSAKDVPDGETPGVDSDLICHKLFCDEEITGQDTPSITVELEPETQVLPGIDSDSCSLLLDSPSGKPVKEEQETCVNLVPHAFIAEKLDELDFHLSNSVPVKLVVEARSLDELDVHPLMKPAMTQESEVHVLDGLNSQSVPSSSSDKTVEHLDVHPMRSALETGRESEDHISGKHGSQTATCFVCERIDGLHAPLLSNDVLVETEMDVCVPGESDSPIAHCYLLNEEMHEVHCPPLSCSVLVEHNSDDHISGDSDSTTDEKIDRPDDATLRNSSPVDPEWETCSSPDLDSHIARCPFNDDKIDRPDDATLRNTSPVDPEWETCSSPDLDSHIARCSFNDDKTDRPDDAALRNSSPVDPEWETCSSPDLDSHIAPCPFSDDKNGQQDLPSPCNVLLESGNRSYCSPQSDSKIASDSSDSGTLAEVSTISSTSIIPSSEENYMVSPDPPRTEPSQDVSNEHPEKPPPLPPLQWRLGRPRLGLLSTNRQMSDPARGTTPVLPASCQQIDNNLGPLNRITESSAPVSSPGANQRYHNSLVENNDQRVEFERVSTLSAVTDVARTEHDRPFSEACGNIKHQGRVSLFATEVGEYPSDGKVSDGTVLHPLNPTYEHEINEQNPVLHSDISDSDEHPTRTDPTVSVSEDDKTVDNHNAADGVHLYTISSSPGRVSENGCFQQPQFDESFPETSNKEERSSSASYEDKNLIDDSTKSESPSDTEKHTLPGPILEAGNCQESTNLQEQDEDNHKGDLPEDPSPSIESTALRNHPHGNHYLETQNILQSNPSVSWSDDESKCTSDLDGGSYVQAGQPPMMGWTVGPQMLHPNYGTSIEERWFEPEVTDHRLLRKPISMKNIPRNPLVDAVAAHDRSTMRKISEIVLPTDKPKPNDINLLLEQIRSKTFDLKPVSSAKQTSMRSPSRSSTRNLKVSAIIEKANAIRQAVGSDDDDEDNWSDT